MTGTSSAAATPEPVAIARIETALRAGRAVILPTDTVYGVAMLASTPGAARILSELKGRSPDQPLAVLVADVDQALSWAEPLSGPAAELADAFWPGPLTLVLRRRPERHHIELGGDVRTVGVRCPDDPVIHGLANRLGSLVTTSANAHGDPTPDTAAAAAGALRGQVEVVLDGGTLRRPASTVVDCTTDPVRILRAGALSVEAIESVLHAGS